MSSKMSWGNAKLWPVVAIVVGLSGGFALGRGLRQTQVTAATEPGGDPAAADPPGETRARPDPVAPSPSPTALPTPTVVNPAPAPTPRPRPAPAAPTTRPARAMAKAHFVTNPEGAQVARASDGEPLGTTPFDLDLPESEEPLVLLFWKKGYAPTEKQIVPHGDVTLNVQLTPAAGEKSARSSSGSKPKKKRSVDKHVTIDPFN